MTGSLATGDAETYPQRAHDDSPTSKLDARRNLRLALFSRFLPRPARAATYKNPATLKLLDTTTTSVQTIERSRLHSSCTDQFECCYACRVAADLKPTPDSDAKIEEWMPPAG